MRGNCRTFILATALAAFIGAQPALAGPAPVERFGLHVPTTNGAVTVRPGDTIQVIAKMYRLQVTELAALNGISPPYKLKVGQRLLLPMPHEHRVGANDTLYSLARMYGTTVDDIARLNNLKQPYVLKVGQVLQLPGSDTTPAAPPRVAEKTTPLKKTNASGVQMLREPGPSPTHAAFDSLLSKLAGGSDEQKPAVKAEPVSLVTAATAVPPASPPAEVVGRSSREGFIWPVRGQVISSYGAKSGGLYNDGINIAAPRGTPVKSAADGVVAYVGDKLKSYGNLVLIRHPGGMVTAYAHLHAVQVKVGTHVARGQVIGVVGSTGTVLNAQLHFEVRRGTQTIDPKVYLG